MRRVRSAIAALLVVAVALAQPGCGPKVEGGYDPDYAVGVVKTTTAEDSSCIEFYDEELRLVNSIHYPYQGLASNYALHPFVAGGRLWLVPTREGYGGYSRYSKLISIDLQSGQVKEYPIQLVEYGWAIAVNLEGVVTDGSHAYVAIVDGAHGRVSRLELETGDELAMEMWSHDSIELVLDGDDLYCSSTYNWNYQDFEWLTHMNGDFVVVDSVDLTETAGVESASNLAMLGDGNLYLISTHKPLETGELPPGQIFRYSKATGEVTLFHEAEQGLIKDFVGWDDRVAVLGSPSHDTGDGEGDAGYSGTSGYIDVLDIGDGSLLSTIELDYQPRSAVIRDGCIYVLSFRWDGLMVKYRIDGDALTEVARVDFYQPPTPARPGDYYPTMVFGSIQAAPAEGL